MEDHRRIDTGSAVEGRWMPGPYMRFDVGSAAEALATARLLKEQGRYRYFRGQRDAGWHVTSSFARLGPDDRLVAQRRAGAFNVWAAGSPELVPYLDNEDKVLATIQHYQIAATTLIDFTRSPEVALWFAMDGAEIGAQGAIYLVQPEEVTPVFEAFCRTGPILRFIELDVPNLWRLETQQGLFLEAQVDVDAVWPFDRIVFPHSGEEPPLDGRLIYPDRRSQLECAIDGYLAATERQQRMREFIRDTPGARHIQIEDEVGSVPGLDPSTLPPGWAVAPHEPWSTVDIASPPPLLPRSVIMKGGEALEAVVAARRRATDLLRVDEAPLDVPHLQPALDRLWEGMRPYPYTGPEIAHTVNTTARYLNEFGDADLSSGKELRRLASGLLADPVEIEIGLAVGSTRAFVAGESLWACLTPAARELLGVPQQPTGERLMSMLAQRYGATLDLFDGSRLISLFTSEIVPWQLAGRRPVICYSPTNIERLGLP